MTGQCHCLRRIAQEKPRTMRGFTFKTDIAVTSPPRLLHLEVFRRFLAPVGNDLVFDGRAFVERAQARPLHGRDMHEHVLAAGLGLNEAVSFGRVEPLHGTCRHCRSPMFTSKPATIRKSASQRYPPARM